jgi:hypothetical protein
MDADKDQNVEKISLDETGEEQDQQGKEPEFDHFAFHSPSLDPLALAA